MAEFSASDSEGDVYEVERILASRKTGRTTEYLVKWKKFDETHNSWEPVRNLGGAKEALAEFLMGQKSPATPEGETRSVKKVTTSSKSLGGGSTITRTVTTTSSKADLSSPESSPVLRRRTVETTRQVLVSGGSKQPTKRSRNIFGRLLATLRGIPVPIMIQIVCLLVFFGTFLPLKVK